MKRLLLLLLPLLMIGNGRVWADETTPTFNATSPQELTNGWYQIKWVNTANASDYTDSEVEDKFVANYAQDVTVNEKCYALYLSNSAPSTLTEHAKTFVYLEDRTSEGDYGSHGNLRSSNGHYISRTGESSLTKPDPNYIIYFSKNSYPQNSVITSSTTAGSRISLAPQGKSATPYIGQTNTTEKFPMVQFSPVSLSDIGLQAWTVSMSGLSETIAATNAQVSYTGSEDLYGLTSVYNHGTFFFASGTTPSANDFTGTTINNITPTVTIDSGNHIINVAYNVTVTYQIVWNGASLSGITEDAVVTRGDALTIPSTLQRDDCTYIYYTDAACSSEVSNLPIDTNGATTTIYVKCVWDRYFIPSTPANPVYYALKISGNDGSWWKPNTTTLNSVTATYAHCVANNNVLPDGDATTWAWILEGNPYNGFKIYSVSESKYLGGRTAKAGYFTLGESASANAFVIKASNSITFYDETYDLYIDRSNGYAYAHSGGQNMTFQRLYKVKFALDTEEAGLQVGSDEVADFDTDYIITTSASLSTTNASYKIKTYDGYSTLADALTNDNDGTINIVTDLSKSITYNLTWNETPIASKTSVQSQWVGDDVLDAATVFGTKPLYCDYGTPDFSTIGESTTEVNISLDWDGPFDISSDFENANWCYLKMHGQYLIYSGSTPYSLGDLAAAEAAGYNAFWAFVGDPVNGFQLINKAAGSDKNLVVAWFPNMGTANTKWFLQQWNDDFALRTNNYLYLNNADGQLKLWVSGQSEEATDFDCKIESASYRGLALAFIDDYADSHALGHYFGVATSTYNSVRAGFADAASVSASDYTQLVSFIGGMLPASYPETGYYRIKSNSGRYIGYGQPEANPTPSVGLRTVSAEDAVMDASTVIHLTKGLGGHQYTMSTEGLNVQSMTSGNTPFPATDASAATFILTASSTITGKGTIYNTASNDEEDENVNGYLHEANWSVPGVVNWNATSDASKWEIEDATDVTLSLNAVGGVTYGTTYLPFGVTLPAESDVRAYTLKDLHNGWARPVLLGEDGKSIPAGTPVLLRGTSTTSVTATIESVDEIEIEENILDGTYVSKAHGNNLVLGKYDGVIGFYKYAFDINPNKAYIPADAEVKGFMLSWDETTVGVDDNISQQEQQKPTIYNISGQRVSQPTRGIYIVNGRKMVIK